MTILAVIATAKNVAVAVIATAKCVTLAVDAIDKWCSACNML